MKLKNLVVLVENNRSVEEVVRVIWIENRKNSEWLFEEIKDTENKNILEILSDIQEITKQGLSEENIVLTALFESRDRVLLKGITYIHGEYQERVLRDEAKGVSKIKLYRDFFLYCNYVKAASEVDRDIIDRLGLNYFDVLSTYLNRTESSFGFGQDEIVYSQEELKEMIEKFPTT